MDIDTIIAAIQQFIASNPVLFWIATILGSLIVVASTYVKLTPTTTDDAWWAKLEAIPVVGWIIMLVSKFSVFKRKE